MTSFQLIRIEGIIEGVELPRMGLGARAAFGHKSKLQLQRRAEMRAAKEEMQREQRAQVEAWFASFDLNEDGVLQRTELAALFKHISGIAPSDEALDMTLADARAFDAKAGCGRKVHPADAVLGQSLKFTTSSTQLYGVSKKAAFAVVTKFSVRLAASSTSQPASR